MRERLPDVRLVLATREEEAFGIAAGLFLGGKRPTVMLQSSGLGNSLNALTSLLIPYRIPVLLVRQHARRSRRMERRAGADGARGAVDSGGDRDPHVTAESPETTAEVVKVAGLRAFDTRLPVACLLPRRLTTGV